MKYEIPKRKKQMVYDFYTVISLPTWLIHEGKHDADALITAINIRKELMVNAIHEHMLEKVHYVLCCEFRHIIDSVCEREDINGVWRNEAEDWCRENGYSKLYKHLKEHNVLTRKMGYRIINRHMTRYQLAVAAEYLFNNLVWQSAYGGKSWGQVASGWLRLYNAKSLDDKIIAIDHIFDLEHNNGTIFDKLKDYEDMSEFYGVIGHDWIAETLENKKHAKSVWCFWNEISSPVKDLTARAMKCARNETLEYARKKNFISERN